MIEWHANTLWHHTAPCRRFGLDIGQRMTVFRLDDGSLLVHNPSELTPSIQSQLERLGEVSCVTTANQYLHQSLSDWWLAYPKAFFFSAPGLAVKRTDIGFDGVLTSTTSPLWRNRLFQTVLRGDDEREEVVFCDPQSRTLVMGESLICINDGSLTRQAAARLLGCYKEANVPLYYQLKVKDHKLLRQSLQEILTWPFDHILPIHGDPILFDGKKKLAAAYLWAFHHDRNS